MPAKSGKTIIILTLLLACCLLLPAGCTRPVPALTNAIATETAPAPTPTLLTAPSQTPRPTPTLAPTTAPTPLPTAAPTPQPTKSPPADGIIYYNGYADPRTITPEMVEDPASLTVLVNKYFALPADYVPPLTDVPGTGEQLHPAANEAWLRMSADCAEAVGTGLELLCGYLSYEDQAASFLDAIRRKGIAGTVLYNALEGRSEHQLGLAVDVSDGLGEPFQLAFGKTETFAWLAAHAHEYGFILRYQAGKEKITDYHAEPWHFRFIGVEAAGKCYAQGWVLEEYRP